MRRPTFLLLILLSVSWASNFGQSAAPKLTSPIIVATFERLGQTTRIAPTTIYTPLDWGTFRVSIVMVGTVANGHNSGDWTGQVQFTDGAGKDFETFFSVNLQTVNRGTAAAEFPIRAAPGKPIKFLVRHNNRIGGSKYNVWVVVEQLM
jgi:hypothetical protein